MSDAIRNTKGNRSCTFQVTGDFDRENVEKGFWCDGHPYRYLKAVHVYLFSCLTKCKSGEWPGKGRHSSRNESVIFGRWRSDGTQKNEGGREHIHRVAGTKCSESTKGGCEEWQVRKAGRREGNVNVSFEFCHANPPWNVRGSCLVACEDQKNFQMTGGIFSTLNFVMLTLRRRITSCKGACPCTNCWRKVAQLRERRSTLCKRRDKARQKNRGQTEAQKLRFCLELPDKEDF